MLQRALLWRAADGGASWTEVYSGDATCSVVNAHFVSPAEVWVTGGLGLSTQDQSGAFWHSTDAGKTFEVETVPGLYLTVRPGARYYHSIRLLDRVKQLDPGMFTKSGIMVGLGESDEELEEAMALVREAGVDLITLGQYLAPSSKHLPSSVQGRR